MFLNWEELILWWSWDHIFGLFSCYLPLWPVGGQTWVKCVYFENSNLALCWAVPRSRLGIGNPIWLLHVYASTESLLVIKLIYYLSISVFYLISQFVQNSNGEDDASFLGPFKLVLCTLSINILGLRPCQIHLVAQGLAHGKCLIHIFFNRIQKMFKWEASNYAETEKCWVVFLNILIMSASISLCNFLYASGIIYHWVR